jgi:hypothetical protein
MLVNAGSGGSGAQMVMSAPASTSLVASGSFAWRTDRHERQARRPPVKTVTNR